MAVMSKSQELMTTILKSLPAEAEITRIEYEGPRIAIYTKNYEFLTTNNYIISDIVNTVKRRLVIRTDKSIRKKENEASEILKNSIDEEVGLGNIYYDDALGEVIIEVLEPQKLTNNSKVDLHKLSASIGWKIVVKKGSDLPSTSIKTIYYVKQAESESRSEFYRQIGEEIFRPKLSKASNVTLKSLGGFNQVGRSCMLLTTPESKILLDCGILPNARNTWDSYPRLDWADFDMDDLDAVVISHAHLDHSGYLPVLFKYGYRGPVYCTEPTLSLMALLHNDYVKINSHEGSQVLYEGRDVRKMIQHTITLPYGLVTDISPDIKLVLNNAGHILGSATCHLHIGEGLHNILYTGDFKFAKTKLFDETIWNYPRVETLIMESTYGGKADMMPSREQMESNLVNSINSTLEKGGKVLIPSPAVGRAQEIMLVLDQQMREKKLIECPIYLEGMISEATAIHIASTEFLSRDLRNSIARGQGNPFQSEYFTVIDHHSKREEVLRDEPAIIMATSGMLEGGPVMRYFEELSPIEKNKLIFVSYQIAGTLGRRIMDGANQASIVDQDGKIKIVDIKCPKEKIDGFSGHSDYNQLIRFVGKLRPKLRNVVIVHGERTKVENLANSVSRIYRIRSHRPEVQEAIKLI